MYRSLAVPVILLALACRENPGVANSSDTAGRAAGPLSITDSARGRFVSTAEASPATSGAGRADRVPNELGRIMVVEYHLLGDRNTTYTRERASFRRDLELLHRRGYRPVNMAQVLDRKIDLPRGLSPVVFTFDDASPGQFSYIERDGKLEI
ncbi:MAG: hypothetical protein M3365_01890, partial [Gemmatimonadota bacterium]|nr:hypothetical protein [Gemmatimonadota bacterium]